MTKMKGNHSLLAILALIHLSFNSPILGYNAAAAASSSGERGSTAAGAEEETTTTTTCHPNDFLLNGKASSSSPCDAATFSIATLTSPRRCIHIEAPRPSSSSSDDDDPQNMACSDFPGWFDGTNGCDAYSLPGNENWCALYGDLNYGHHTPHGPKAACCACGGGTRSPARLRAGDYVRLLGTTGQHNNNYAQCESLRIAEVNYEPKFHYVVEVRKACGPMQFVRDGRTGHVGMEESFQPGKRLSVWGDDPASIVRMDRVELRKCRAGLVEQEFELVPMGSEEGEAAAGGDGRSVVLHHMVVIRHRATGIGLDSALGATSPFFNVTRVWEDGLFEGSGDYFSIKAVTDANEGRVNWDGTPYGPTHSFLASGCFGEKEFSEVKTKSDTPDFNEQEFSMWQFQPFLEADSDSASAAVDEHSEWLIRITQTTGIDYLEQLPPWHLLDVDRDASKGDVKARFRELSRYFHPDKLVRDASEKEKELFERVFVLLQNAYQGLKGADEREKEEFRVQAESGSQLFARSQHVVELLPFHWTKIDNGTDEDEEEGGEEKGSGRFILNVASHLDSTLSNVTFLEEEREPSVQLWVTLMYSARCGMSRTVRGYVDLAARHLEKHENIKVGAYGCGLYKDHPPTKLDLTGVKSDPICAQFARTETPNVHVVVETLPGRRRDENGVLVEVPLDAELVKENALFKYFYAAVPNGNTTQFYPHRFIDFARAGKRIWQNNHLVSRMAPLDFDDPEFMGNISIVAYLDGTGKGETDAEIVDAVANSLPAVARRFLADDVHVGTAHCGYGDEYDMDGNDAESKKHVDCSKHGVSWLPDIKIYGVNDTEGISLLRGQFGDVRDVQIALESMGNVLRMMMGGTDKDFEDDFEEMEDDDDIDEGGGSCGNDQPPPPRPPDFDPDLDEIEGRMEETPLLEMDEEEEVDKTEPVLETEPKPALGADKAPKKPKLASSDDRPQLTGGREKTTRDRISGFHQRETKRTGRGQILGGGGGGSAGFIA